MINPQKAIEWYKNTYGDNNQSDYDIESSEWFRNTNLYNLNQSNSGYDYIFNSDSIRKQSIDITASSLGVSVQAAITDATITSQGTTCTHLIKYSKNSKVIIYCIIHLS